MSGTSLVQSRRGGRRGNALLDAALVLPILLSLTFGTVEYGYFFFVKHSLQGAAREGCRVGIVPSSDNTQVSQAVAAKCLEDGLIVRALPVGHVVALSPPLCITREQIDVVVDGLARGIRTVGDDLARQGVWKAA